MKEEREPVPWWVRRILIAIKRSMNAFLSEIEELISHRDQ